MWQGSNRLQANRIDIDRKNGRLQAEGNVFSQLLDKAETEKQKKGAVFTVVRAPIWSIWIKSGSRIMRAECC